ncbi:hypothetical protein AAEX37_01099 [Oligella sp. MSHR50489EDL]|uniref:GIY-YIG nuclease family protein n=1 Tax=Oligella sp. MSHR50489EDL TaxID=3139409 RepID=UPI003D81742C
MAIRHSQIKAASRLSLDDIFSGSDEFGLLDVAPKAISQHAPIEITNFEAINAFVDQHGRAPSQDGDLAEKLLARRLTGYQNNVSLHDALAQYDRYGLLGVVQHEVVEASGEVKLDTHISIDDEKPKSIAPEEVTSLDDIFASAEFNELDLGDQSLFDIKHIPAVTEREQPDEIAQRRVCEDFYQFKSIFLDAQQALKSGEMETVRFNLASQVEEGDLFIMEGVLCLIDEIGDYREDNQGRYDPRLRVIFENGTESNHLLQSLAKRLYMDETGRRVVRSAESVVDAFNNISHKDKRAGQIYFVTTLSDNPVLKAIPNLIKIGYTEQTVEERTKNAERDIAFLEAPVKILATIECYNLNPNKFESLIHGFLHAQRLQMTLVANNGKTYNPREWFSVSLDTAREVVRRIIDGSIVHYRMDNTTGRLVRKGSKVN